MQSSYVRVEAPDDVHSLRRREGSRRRKFGSINQRTGLRKTTKASGLDHITIRAILNGKQVIEVALQMYAAY